MLPVYSGSVRQLPVYSGSECYLYTVVVRLTAVVGAPCVLAAAVVHGAEAQEAVL